MTWLLLIPLRGPPFDLTLATLSHSHFPRGAHLRCQDTERQNSPSRNSNTSSSLRQSYSSWVPRWNDSFCITIPPTGLWLSTLHPHWPSWFSCLQGVCRNAQALKMPGPGGLRCWGVRRKSWSQRTVHPKEIRTDLHQDDQWMEHKAYQNKLF